MPTPIHDVFPYIRLTRSDRIDLEVHDDVSIWMGRFGVTEAVLREAVQRVGPSPDAVRTLLRHGPAAERARAPAGRA